MKVEEEKKIRNIINQGLKKQFSLSETDLLAPNTKTWDSIKGEFKSVVSNLISNLENDDYDDASGDITKAIAMLRSWKKNIEKDINDSSIKENKESLLSLLTPQQIIKHNITEGFIEYIIPGTEKFSYGPDEDGTYQVEAQIAIPRRFFDDLESATFKTQEELESNNYRGPGQPFSKINVYAIKQSAEYYILGINIRGGYDI